MMETYLYGSKALRQWPGGTFNTFNCLESISFRVGECTNTGDVERLYSQTPSDSRLKIMPESMKKLNWVIQHK